ncbi:hypothetical protein CHH92_18610 [Bacillus sonorensis]|uniref:hypothetical protein n=2 Tax=Bacillus sonorensis TaxID=119858 RepID=UPI000349D1EC|nr:hypothetical protein [Bacillus sonorensis]TWK84411.1 hypothetical protein CHCC20335_4479 [Bacillus paralicheniformis]MBG9914952.1 hypothetical protein [Bacillus sonorensis]MCY8034404.1 hypothetical protein [Bacillus sonorensis]PAD58853.1 hypothetical protein CHH92_18610 [Bacillus sonorensis]RHJ06689.1 hypothetical protein DW143_20155 [Bacillus sonorensis]
MTAWFMNLIAGSWTRLFIDSVQYLRVGKTYGGMIFFKMRKPILFQEKTARFAKGAEAVP